MEDLLKIKKIVEKNKIKSWLFDNTNLGCGLIDYVINDDFTIDVNGQLYITSTNTRTKPIEELPDYIKFRFVAGTFSIGVQHFKSTKGFPKSCITAEVRVVGPYKLQKPDWCVCENWNNV